MAVLDVVNLVSAACMFVIWRHFSPLELGLGVTELLSFDWRLDQDPAEVVFLWDIIGERECEGIDSFEGPAVTVFEAVTLHNNRDQFEINE